MPTLGKELLDCLPITQVDHPRPSTQLLHGGFLLGASAPLSGSRPEGSPPADHCRLNLCFQLGMGHHLAPVLAVADTTLLGTAARMVRAATAVSRVWPGYWPQDQAFLLLLPPDMALLITTRAAPPEYQLLAGPSLPSELRARAYLRRSYPSNLVNSAGRSRARRASPRRSSGSRRSTPPTSPPPASGRWETSSAACCIVRSPSGAPIRSVPCCGSTSPCGNAAPARSRTCKLWSGPWNGGRARPSS